MEKAILLDKTHLDYFGLLWVLKAIDKNNTFKTINRLNITEGLAIGTNGHRLHQYTLSAPSDFEMGVYKFFISDPQIILIKTLDKYVNWKEALPTGKPTKSIKVPATEREWELNTCYAKLVRFLPGEEGIHLAYFKDALSFGEEYEVFWYEPFKQIVFSAKDHQAIIMPMRY